MNDFYRTSKILEAIRKATQHCRTCDHERMSHYSGKCVLMTKMWDCCQCVEFVPPDNLDYIEWLAKKKGLIQ